jgi:hypothetical protein
MNAAATPSSRRPRPVALLVHEASVPYVRSVVAFMRRQLAVHAGGEPFYAECATVAQARVPAGAVVYLVGEGFPRFEREPGCGYVFVNFSLLRRMRWWKPVLPAAGAWMRQKRRALLARRDQFDMVLDFHPAQTRWLARALAPSPVRTFMMGVPEEFPHVSRTPASTRRWDVCLVGTESPRRARMRERLQARGLSVSPATAPGLEAVIGDCRVVANVHFAACDTLEAPRVVHALTAGVCLVTEPCVGLDAIAPPSCYVTASYRRMPDVIAGLVADPGRFEAIAQAGADHIRAVYGARADAGWRALVRDSLALGA